MRALQKFMPPSEDNEDCDDNKSAEEPEAHCKIVVNDGNQANAGQYQRNGREERIEGNRKGTFEIRLFFS